MIRFPEWQRCVTGAAPTLHCINDTPTGNVRGNLNKMAAATRLVHLTIIPSPEHGTEHLPRACISQEAAGLNVCSAHMVFSTLYEQVHEVGGGGGGPGLCMYAGSVSYVRTRPCVSVSDDFAAWPCASRQGGEVELATVQPPAGL